MEKRHQNFDERRKEIMLYYLIQHTEKDSKKFTKNGKMMFVNNVKKNKLEKIEDWNEYAMNNSNGINAKRIRNWGKIFGEKVENGKFDKYLE